MGHGRSYYVVILGTFNLILIIYYPLNLALQNVLGHISLPNLVSSVASSSATQLVSQVITTTSQDQSSSSPMIQEPQQMQQFVPQSDISLVQHLVSSGSSSTTTHLTQVVTSTSQSHPSATSQMVQESPHIQHHYVQQPGVPMIQNLIECETQDRL